MNRIALCAAVLAAAVMSSDARAAGALAIGQCGAFGYAYDYGSERAAGRDALRQCKGRGCKVVARFTRMCAAFAVDGANPCGAFGWATRNGDRLAMAQNEALRVCHLHGGRDCMIRAFVCDGK